MVYKKDQKRSVGKVILIIFGVVILIVLIVFILSFTLGWQRVFPWMSDGGDPNSIVNSCSVACSTGGYYDFCEVKMTINDGINKKFEATCNELSTNPTYILREYGIFPCADLCEDK